MTDIFSIPPLPYPADAFANFGMSAKQMNFHHDVHHQSYATKLNAAAATNTKLQSMTVEQIMKSETGPLFNLASQLLLHTEFFASLNPAASGDNLPPAGSRIEAEINASFGSFDKFKADFTAQAVGHFGSGWVFVTKNGSDPLQIVQTHDAGNPTTSGAKILLACDVWEHAYYESFGPSRPKYMEFFWKVANWNRADQILASAQSKQ